MRPIYCIVLWIISVSAGIGQDEVALRSTAGAGWTSNATETPDGPSDFFVEHDHELSLSGSFGPMSLRGTLLFEQTHFVTIEAEDDMSAAAGLEAALELDRGMVLRAGYALTRDWIGEGLPIEGAVIGVASGKLTHEAMLELAIAGADQQVTVSVEGSWRYPEDAVISGLPIALPPTRLDPQVSLIGVGIDWEKAATGSVAVLGRMEADFSNVPEADQFLYERLPGTAASVAGGARLKAGNLLVEVLAGASLVWPLINSGLRQVPPFLVMRSELALGQHWSMAARAEKRVEMDDPLDPVASTISEAELSARYRMTEALSLTAAVGSNYEAGIFDPEQFRKTITASLRLEYAMTDHASISLAALRKWVDEPGGAYEADRFTMALNAQF